MWLLEINPSYIMGPENPDIHLKFFPGNVPPYAILSHRWGPAEEEVNFQDLIKHTKEAESEAVNDRLGSGMGGGYERGGFSIRQSAYDTLLAYTKKKGWVKFRECGKRALKDGLSYAWIDTCCIDKSSSAELSEAINSMYEWYRCAAVCYAYLEDVPAGEDPRLEDSSFRKSAWFTRAWTLQELIAPSSVDFFARDWTPLSNKAELADLVEQITNVGQDILLDTTKLPQASIAKKMSWASLRQSTRIEDEAYSLIGIFGVNMPTIYGEGGRAFTRLQQEIMRSSTDQSLFAWEGTNSFSGMLATSPRHFAKSAGYEPMEYEDFTARFGIRVEVVRPTGFDGVKIPIGGPKPEYSMSNFGVHIQLPMVHMSNYFQGQVFAFLACTHGPERDPVVFFLRRRPGRTNSHFYRTIFNGRGLGKISIAKWERGLIGGPTIHTDIIWVSGDEPMSRLPDIAPLVSIPDRPFRYDFSAKIEDNGFVAKIVDVHPPKLITVSSDGTQADATFANSEHVALAFRHLGSGERMTFIIGAHNWRVWFDGSRAGAHTDRVESAEKLHDRWDMFHCEGWWQQAPDSLRFAEDPKGINGVKEYKSAEFGNFKLDFRKGGSVLESNAQVEKFSLAVKYAPNPPAKERDEVPSEDERM